MQALFFLILQTLPAQAVTVEPALLAWSSFGLSEARQDAQVRGPELLHAGTDDRLALYDGVRREVHVLEGDAPAVSFPVHFASDLLLVDDGTLVLDHSARTVTSWDRQGRPRAVVALPALVPTAVTLRLEGDQVLAVDPFGHGHPVASLDGLDLTTSRLEGLQRRPDAVVWDGDTMRTEGLELELPHATKASGQRLGDWLVVDVVVADAPITVERTAWHIPSRQAQPLPVDGRLYAPRGDLAATPEGDLVVLVPRAEGLELLRVSP